MERVVGDVQPDRILAQGDTTTTMAASLAAFHIRVPVAHIEAGLRTNDLMSPWPEEANRRIVIVIADMHFAPTDTARDNLLGENVKPENIYVTGNTVIDALHETVHKDLPIACDLDDHKRLILLTAHRRENFGAPFLGICRAIRELADLYEDVQILYPVHPNPNIYDVVHHELGNHPRIVLTKPLDYGPFVSAMKKSYLILTDSGGVQEEAPALGKPVLVLRDETERPEAVEAGVVKIVGTDPALILTEARRLLDDGNAYRKMAKGVSPYGDGQAAERIVNVLEQWQPVF